VSSWLRPEETSPDPRVRARIGLGNDCEPYVDFGILVQPQDELPNCALLDLAREIGRPDLAEDLYAGVPAPTAADRQVRLTATRTLEQIRAARILNVSSPMAMTTTWDQQKLAEALIASGQLTLGADAFRSPDAQAALAMALAAASTATASPTGGSMSAPWFGLGGSAPGLSFPISFQPFGSTPFAALPPAGDAAGGGGGGGFFDLLGTGLQIGGQFFLQQQAARQAEELLKQQQRLLQQQSMLGFAPAAPGLAVPFLGPLLGGMAGGLGTGLVQEGMSMLGNLLGGAGPSCGRRPPQMAPSLFRTGCSGKPSLPSRQQIIGPDGNLYVIASLGRATRGSREASTMRRLARDNGFKVSRTGNAGRRGRRSPR